MKTDIARQSLVTAFLTQVAVAVAALCFGRGDVMTEVSSEGWLPGRFITGFQIDHPVWACSLALFCLLFAGLSLGRLSNRYNLYAGTCYLTIPLFGIAACGIAVAPAYFVQSLSALLLALAFKNYCLGFRNGYGFNGLFRASLYLGFLPLLLPPTVPLLLLMPLAVFLFRRTFRELAVALFGLILPAFFLCYLAWACGDNFFDPLSGLITDFMGTFCLPKIPTGFPTSSFTSLLLAASLLLLTLGAIAIQLQNMYIVSHKARLIFIFCICLLVLTFAESLFSGNSPEVYSLVAIPVSILLPVFFVRTHLKFSLLIYLFFLVCSFINTFTR